MTNPAYEATNSDVEKLIARIKPDVEIALDKQSTKAERYAAMDRVADLPGMMVVGKLIAALEQAQAQSSKWLEAYHKEVSVGARYEERIAELESAPNAMMRLSNELAEMKRKCAELEARSITVKWPDYVDGRTLGYGEVNHMIDLCVDAVELACHASGIRIKSED